MLYKIKKQFEREHSMYYHIHEVKVNRRSEDMVEVTDIHDGLTFWIDFQKLEPV